MRLEADGSTKDLKKLVQLAYTGSTRGELTKREIRIIQHYIWKRDFDLWWWELEDDKQVYVDDLADYTEFLRLMDRRQKMKEETARQLAEKQAKK